MALHRVTVFEATADVLGSVRKVRYALDQQCLSIEALNLEEAMVMLQRLEAAVPVATSIPKNEAELLAAMKTADEPKPSFEKPIVVTATPVKSDSSPATPPPGKAGDVAPEARTSTPTTETQTGRDTPSEQSKPSVATPPATGKAIEAAPTNLPPPPSAQEVKVVVKPEPKPVTMQTKSAGTVPSSTTTVAKKKSPGRPPTTPEGIEKARQAAEAKAAAEREMAQKWLKENAAEIAKPPADVAGGNGSSIQKDFAKVKDETVAEPIPGEVLTVDAPPAEGVILAPVMAQAAPQADDVDEHGIPNALVKATSLREVLSQLAAMGVTEEPDVIARCVAIRPHVPVVKNIINLEERIRRALSVMQA